MDMVDRQGKDIAMDFTELERRMQEVIESHKMK